MLPKTHLTSNFRMPRSRWVITPSWLSGSWRSFLYNSSVYSYHLFLTFSASIRSIPILPLMCPFNAWNVPLVSLIFLERSLVFPILLLSSISLHWSLRWSEEVKSLSRVWLSATPWTIAYQVPPPMGFSRQEYWSGLPFPSPGDLPNPGIEPKSAL